MGKHKYPREDIQWNRRIPDVRYWIDAPGWLWMETKLIAWKFGADDLGQLC